MSKIYIWEFLFTQSTRQLENLNTVKTKNFRQKMGNMTDVNKETEKNTLANVENCHIALIIYRPGGYLISSLSVQKCLGIFE